MGRGQWHTGDEKMTIPRERTSAVIRARSFLLRLCTPYGDGFKKIPSEVRDEARRILRHYPGSYDLCREGAFDPDTAAEYGERERAAWLQVGATKTEQTSE